MTPIDWKHAGVLDGVILAYGGRHSLVTPIDWKLEKANPIEAARPAKVANLW